MKSLTTRKSTGGRSKMLLAILDTFQAIMSKRKSCSVFKNMSESLSRVESNIQSIFTLKLTFLSSLCVSVGM